MQNEAVLRAQHTQIVGNVCCWSFDPLSAGVPRLLRLFDNLRFLLRSPAHLPSCPPTPLPHSSVTAAVRTFVRYHSRDREKKEYNGDHAGAFTRSRRRGARHRPRNAQENARNSLVHHQEGLVESGGWKGGCPASRGALGGRKELPGACCSQQQH